MMFLGQHGWNIKFSNDNFCWKHNKIITIDIGYNGDLRQIILHEIAHINTARFSNQKHNLQFWKYLEYLTRKFLKNDLDDNQLKHKKFMTIG